MRTLIRELQEGKRITYLSTEPGAKPRKRILAAFFDAIEHHTGPFQEASVTIEGPDGDWIGGLDFKCYHRDFPFKPGFKGGYFLSAGRRASRSYYEAYRDALIAAVKKAGPGKAVTVYYGATGHGGADNAELTLKGWQFSADEGSGERFEREFWREVRSYRVKGTKPIGDDA